MRIRLLDLIAFGPFTGTRLDFGDGAGLAVVRGPNEAGKTSALRALTQLLYGIPYRSSDMFVHTTAGSLAIRGVLDFGDKGELDVTRYKRNKNDLVDADGATVAQDRLTALMGGVDKTAFATLFGIDQRELDGGGEDILRSGGALGESLFAAAAGIANMRNVLERLGAEADALYTDRGGAGKVLNPLFGAYRELATAQNKAATSTSRWRDLSREERRLDKERAEAQQRLDDLARQKSRLERLAQAAAPARRAMELAEALQGLADAAVLPEDFFEQRLMAEAALAHARETAAQGEEALAEVNERLGALRVDQALLDDERHVLALHQEAHTHTKALHDAEGLAHKRDAHLARARALLDSLGSDVPLERVGELLPAPGQAARIRDLATSHEGLVAREDGARRQADALEAELEAVRGQEPPRPGADTTELAAVLERAAGGNPEARLAETRAALAAEADGARADLARLGLWTGNLDDVPAVDMPLEATARAHAARLAEADADLRSAREALQRAGEQARDARAEAEACAASGEVPSPDELRRTRELRDEGWALAKRSLEGEAPAEAEVDAYLAPRGEEGSTLAQALEADMREADDLADRLYVGADRVARRVQADQAAARDAARAEAARGRVADCEARRSEILREWEALWRPVGVAPLPPAEMAAWLSGWTALRRRVQALAAARAQEGRLQAEAAALRRALAEALVRMDEPAPAPDAPLDSVLALARAARERHDALRRAARDHTRRAAEIGQRLRQARADLARAREDMAQWAERWAEAVRALGLAPTAPPSEAQEVLDTLAQLAAEVDKAEEKAGRIRDIEADFAAYKAAVAEAAGRFAPELADENPMEAVKKLSTLREATRDAAKERDRLERERERLEHTVHDARNEEARHAQTLRLLCGKAQCETPGALPEAERRSRERVRVEEELAALRERLAELAAGTDAEALAAEALELDPDQAAADLARLAAELEELSTQRDELNQRYGAARQELKTLDGRSEAAELAERAQSTAADIQEGLDRYVRLRLAERVVRSEIERFRKANQGPVLRHASDIFASLTMGSFAGLEADFDDKGDPVIKGMRPTGEGLGVEAMSDGARDQLYLALRLAGLHRRLDNSRPMPFVVDDILVNFDDDRARAALAALGDLAARTQVVFFTHHKHLADLAREAIPPEALREIIL